MHCHHGMWMYTTLGYVSKIITNSLHSWGSTPSQCGVVSFRECFAKAHKGTSQLGEISRFGMHERVGNVRNKF